VPEISFFENQSWVKFNDWKSVLSPFYEKAKFMLGTTPIPKLYEEDHILEQVATDMGRAHTFKKVDVGVYFGDSNKPIDPYFGGEGPLRTGCTNCAGCMVGCRYGAKNTLDKNYLYFAKKYNTEILPERIAEKIEFNNGIYSIGTTSSTALIFKNKKIYKSKGIIISAGVLGTMKLLLDQKYRFKTLTKLSNKLGASVRTNSESLCGISLANQKLNHGVAISSGFNPDEHTNVEIVKYSNGSGVMGKFASIAVDGNHPFTRFLKWLLAIITHPIKTLRVFFDFEFGSKSIILLVMQTLDNALKIKLSKSWLGTSLKIVNDGNLKVPAYIGIGQEVMHRYAEKVGGVPLNALTEITLNMATTAHIIGGCSMGENVEEGVIDHQFKVHGYENMLVLDGSIIQGNLGVNPSLTITAVSEYAMSLIPEKVVEDK
jgi:cholesterol oxidase